MHDVITLKLEFPKRSVATRQRSEGDEKEWQMPVQRAHGWTASGVTACLLQTHSILIILILLQQTTCLFIFTRNFIQSDNTQLFIAKLIKIIIELISSNVFDLFINSFIHI